MPTPNVDIIDAINHAVDADQWQRVERLLLQQHRQGLRLLREDLNAWLLQAFKRDRWDIIRRLILLGATPRRVINGHTLLYYAVKHQQRSLFPCLIRSTADIHFAKPGKQSAAQLAIAQHDFESLWLMDGAIRLPKKAGNQQASPNARFVLRKFAASNLFRRRVPHPASPPRMKNVAACYNSVGLSSQIQILRYRLNNDLGLEGIRFDHAFSILVRANAIFPDLNKWVLLEKLIRRHADPKEHRPLLKSLLESALFANQIDLVGLIDGLCPDALSRLVSPRLVTQLIKLECWKGLDYVIEHSDTAQEYARQFRREIEDHREKSLFERLSPRDLATVQPTSTAVNEGGSAIATRYYDSRFFFFYRKSSQVTRDYIKTLETPGLSDKTLFIETHRFFSDKKNHKRRMGKAIARLTPSVVRMHCAASAA